MSQNVAEAIEGRAATLFEKMVSNNDVANVVMALVGRLVIIAMQKGKPIEGISLEPCNLQGRRLTARIGFHSLSIQKTSSLFWGPQSDLKRYVASKAANLALVFDRNPGMLSFFTDLISKLDQFCAYKSINFRDLKLEKSVITPTDVLVMNISKDHLGKWER